MVKKKRQSDPSENGDESTESCDETAKCACPHVAKAVDLARLKKALKIGGFERECAECRKSGQGEAADSNYEEDLSLWMCLRCGSQLCGRARNQHALQHYATPRSDCHALTANTSSWEVYCYNCNGEVAPSSSKKLHECVEYLKKQASPNPKLPPIQLPMESPGPLLELNLTVDAVSRDRSRDLPRVRGLTNLGNTCFFNSVMQCLVQTPYLLNVLQEMATPGETFTLPGGKLKLKTEQNGDEGKEVELPPITGQLGEWGALTRTLAETLAELQAGEGGVYTPRRLLGALVSKLPQFGGGDQHDAHELLRHLLEAVRAEDLRRYQAVILARLALSPKADPATVDGELKQKVKFYGQQASDTMLRPEQVFRGFLVSTLECQECFHQSERAEYFLDLSLPVASCRPQPPAALRRKTAHEDTAASPEEKNSKNAANVNKRSISARKAARKNKGNAASKDKTVDLNGKIDSKSSSEQSDADVEDNLEEPPAPPAPPAAPAPHTAAYFAKFLMEADPARTSPVDGDQEKTDDTPEATDKDKEFLSTPIPLEYKPLIEHFSNPDSGVASPETTKHNSTETVDNVDFPSNGKELGSRSSLSSEINLELSSPQHSKQSPVKSEYERPVSRIAFAGECSNEVVSRGISAQAGRELGVADRLERLRVARPEPERYACEEDECSVRSCLAQFTALELLTGNNKVRCDTCAACTNATKRFLVSSAPPVLILHLKRFQLGPRCLFRKMSKHVDFPAALDLQPFCARAHRRPLLYSLYGVVEHSGGMHGGHYVAYVKVRAARARGRFLPAAPDAPASDSELSGYESGEGSPRPQPPARWYYVSDSMVSEVSEEKVLRAQAYLLFYERVL